MADGDDGAVRADDGVVPHQPVGRGRNGPGARKARARALVEKDEVAPAPGADLATKIEERLEGFGADAALLHSGAGVAGDVIHGHLLVAPIVGGWVAQGMSQDYPVAAGWLARVDRANPHYFEAQFFLGLCEYYTGDFASAERAFQIVAAAAFEKGVDWKSLKA